MFPLEEQRALRSALYVPGDRPDRMAKALVAGADAVVVDLEDAVAPSRKEEARRALATFLADLGETPAELQVRINRAGEGWDHADLDAAVHPAVATLRLPKAEAPAAVADLAAEVARRERAAGMAEGQIRFDLLIESARGVVSAPALATAHPRVRLLCLGGADLAEDLQVDRSDPDDPLLVARQHLVLASRAAGLEGPFDTVCTDVNDVARIEAEASAARRRGFSGKSVIHPRQIDPVHRAFAPSGHEVRWATAVQRAWNDRPAGAGTAVVDGEFIDAPVAARAARIVARASGGTP